MSILNEKARNKAKREFYVALSYFVKQMREYVSAEDGEWTVKGFIDIYKNIYTISSDTKIVSKILEIHLFPQILKFAESQKYSIVLAEHQNWYPDLSFISQKDPRIKFAVDIKTTYRNPEYFGHINGFTLGSHGRYFRDRNSRKNIQFPYAEYSRHFCLGIIYTRVNNKRIDESEIVNLQQFISGDKEKKGERRELVRNADHLRSITSVIKDFQFFVCEKWQIASDHQGSGNTANIGSITCIDDILKGNGIFAKLGEKWFDEYWMNYGKVTMIKEGKSVPIRRLSDYVDFKGCDKSLVVSVATRRKCKAE